jgi:hypothetical protein
MEKKIYKIDFNALLENFEEDIITYLIAFTFIGTFLNMLM